MKLTVLTFWELANIDGIGLAQQPHVERHKPRYCNHLMNEDAGVLRQSPSLLQCEIDIAEDSPFFQDAEYSGAYWTDAQLAESLANHRTNLEATLTRRGFSAQDIIDSIGSAQTLSEALNNIKQWMVTP